MRGTERLNSTNKDENLFENRWLCAQATRALRGLLIFYVRDGELVQGCGVVLRVPVPTSAVDLSCLSCGLRRPEANFSRVFLFYSKASM